MNETFLIDFGERLKKARTAMGLSQEELARILGYSHKTSITKLEKGKTDMPMGKLADMARALNVTEEYLMGFDDNQANILTEQLKYVPKPIDRLQDRLQRLTEYEVKLLEITLNGIEASREDK